ncbi:hypothetical protein R1sor_024834 [Riccia sorocarpa]|uniref:Replitron HUH endonuclease domain-containing protein n=1 Tax=Riccia sorocarpa TaxID=122646 RepID=A0ABD3GSE0_9MARC
MKRFVDSRATVGLIALERGDATLQLHIQGVLTAEYEYQGHQRRYTESHWLEERVPTRGAAICVKALINKGVHTLVGMVSYCTKDEQELHYQMYSVNVTAQQMEEGKRRYLIFGACNYKNRVELTPYNLLSRAMQSKHKHEKQRTSNDSCGNWKKGSVAPRSRTTQAITKTIDPEADGHERAEWQDLGDYVPLFS